MAFYDALNAQRIAKGMTWKAVAAESKVSASTLTRMAQGRSPDLDGLAQLCNWSGLKAESFMGGKGKTKKPEQLAMISTLLRADPHLSEEGAKMLDQMIKAAYQQFRKKEN